MITQIAFSFGLEGHRIEPPRLPKLITTRPARTSLVIESPEGDFNHAHERLHAPYLTKPFGDTKIAAKILLKLETLNMAVHEGHDGILMSHGLGSFLPPRAFADRIASPARSICDDYLKSAARQLCSYAPPSQEALKSMGFVARKTSECSTIGNTAVMGWLKKTGLDNPRQATPQDLKKALGLMKQDPEVQACANQLASELKKRGYYENMAACANKQENHQEQKELVNQLYDVAGKFTDVDPRNLFRKTYSMNVLGAATILAGHPNFAHSTMEL